ncbi:hypothetical protein D3X67_01905 [Acinetobacter baumannii]|nr:hypothetical protein D3X67_01905 [Acinetobacter baumannii]
MPKYLAIAEKVYKEIKKDNLFTEDTIQNLNCLISLIRKAIKGTEWLCCTNLSLKAYSTI